MSKCNLVPVINLFLAVLLSGCVASRSELRNAFQGPAKQSIGANPVSVLFAFTHVHQTLGYDAVPKTVDKRESVQDFDQLFAHSLRELGNIGKYETFTDQVSDINQPERRAHKDSLKSQFDYTINIRLVSERRFSSYFLGALASTATATLLPVPYRQHFRMETEIYTRNGKLAATYLRGASLSKWVEAFLLFVYPFYPEKQKREEVFIAILSDTFRQIESEGVLQLR